ncbi:hypothetical protein SPOG_03985 [Schizosaccharomyces cryophilus OY26]|uniref:Uncharacterized protein n=1 Tax=Schizosaccharomyces cryophilus (strain OY26 / ATCC MYA-4695 / CBS 11777 / NBRC 106824 / NRRL Y48691) TaxID=653667 RepID=S9W8E3_SCHCR|nr:uncharacterized protein SPOG_03985 [Schizosaccharomyces cryophilus OY26]EPY54090.1 hypothetical protein SPOG_03985 [Schizosaccharomyces cryophilus OY26]
MEPYILPFSKLKKENFKCVEYPFLIHSRSISLLLTSMVSCLSRNDAQHGLLICPEKEVTEIEDIIIKNEGVFDTEFLSSANSIEYLQYLDKIEILPIRNMKSLSDLMNEAVNQKGEMLVGIVNVSIMLKYEECLNAASLSSILADVIEKCSLLIICETGALETPIPISDSMKHESVTLETVYSLWIPVYLRVSNDSETPRISRASFHSREFSQTSVWKSNTFFQDVKINTYRSYCGT